MMFDFRARRQKMLVAAACAAFTVLHAPLARAEAERLAAAAPGADPEGERVEFRLAPADGTRFLQTLVTQRNRSLEGIGKEEARAIGQTRYAIAQDDDGFTYSGRLVSSKTTRDGKTFDDPYGLVLTDVTVKLDVSPDGIVRRVHGYDGIRDRVKTLFSDEIATRLAPFVGSGVLAERAIADWRGRIGDYVGLTVSIGDTRTERQRYEIPGGGAIDYRVETRFAGWSPCDVGRCLRIETRYDSRNDARAESVIRGATLSEYNEQPAGVESASGKTAPAKRSELPRIAGASTRLVDPSTMLIYSETEERTVWATLDISGLGAVKLTEVSTITYSYEYESSQAPDGDTER